MSLPDFNRTFELEVDACGLGIGTVLSQKGKPLAYLNRAAKEKNLRLSIHEKEFLAILMAVQK